MTGAFQSFAKQVRVWSFRWLWDL